MAGTLRLTKHDAAGNDFLVVVDLEGRRPVSAAEARALCDRHRGIGADGVLRAVRGRGDADVAMDLHNADGTVAEMSGNGIRCLVQAVVDAGLFDAGVLSVHTLAGVRRVDYRPEGVAGTGFARVDMGMARLGVELPPGALGAAEKGRRVDMGNPHIVLFGPPAGDDEVRESGARLSQSAAEGANVEFVWRGAGPDELVMRVWERGVGETLACGTGTCAAAAALHDWGVVGSRLVVHNPGGSLEVELDAQGVMLAGPTRCVGRVEVDEDMLSFLAHAAAADPAAEPAHEVAITQ